MNSLKTNNTLVGKRGFNWGQVEMGNSEEGVFGRADRKGGDGMRS